ncbi:hypothetical protein F4801DRAFT_568093 [Xylaria longipes]|nr:hypothetical protein F4801DRAFT_568093 [Xylaria longipes]
MTIALSRGLGSDPSRDSIADTAGRVRSLFPCCQKLEEDDVRQNVAIQSERYNLWTSNIGVFASRHASLDYRLRTAPSVRAAVDGNLEILCKQLLSVLKGSPNVSDELSVFSDLSQSAVSGFGSRLLLLSKPSPQDRAIALKSIEATITTLHQLSLSIRKASTRNSFMKAQRLFDEDIGYSLLRERVGGSTFPEEYIDPVRFETTNTFRQFVIKYLELKWLQKPVGQAIGPQQEAYRKKLLSRCAEAISLRRRQLIYFHIHQSKLVPRPPTQLVNLTHESAPPRVNSGLQAQASTPSPFVSNASPPFFEQGIPNIAQSDTVPSEFQSTAFRLAPPLTAAPSSTASSEGGALRNTELFEIPPPPELDLGEKEKLCPYCCLVLPSKTFFKRKKLKQWRYHILEDLQPYVCLFKNCNTAGKTFGKFKDWQAHLGQPHCDYWVCPLHPEGQPQSDIFDSPEEFETHLKNFHPDLDSATASQIATSAGWPAPLLQQCFVCFAEIPDANVFQRHLANHLEPAFLMALPWRDDVKDVDLVPSDKVASLTNSNPWDDDDKQHPNVADLFKSAVDNQTMWATDNNVLSKESFAARLAEINVQASSERDKGMSLQEWTSVQRPGILAAPTFHVFTILSIVRFKRLLARKRKMISKSKLNADATTLRGSQSICRSRGSRWRVAMIVISFPIRLQVLVTRAKNRGSDSFQPFPGKAPQLRITRYDDDDWGDYDEYDDGNNQHGPDPVPQPLPPPATRPPGTSFRQLRYRRLQRAPALALFVVGKEKELGNWNRVHNTNFSRN